MFGMFNKKQKSELETLIERDGIDFAAKRCCEIISLKLPTSEIAYQFVLEELEAASQGSDAAVDFARNSGISPREYKGSMSNSMPEVDGPAGPQQLILALCMQLQPNADLVVKFRTLVVDKIMQQFSLGKYSSPKTENITLANIVNRKNQTGYLFGNIINDLGESVEVIMQNSKLIQMTYAYARRSAATVLYIQGVIDLNAYDHNLAFFKSMQLTTGHTVEFQEQAFSDSVDYMQTYSPAITRLLIQTAAAIAQSPSRIPPKGIFSDSKIIKILIDTYVEAMQA